MNLYRKKDYTQGHLRNEINNKVISEWKTYRKTCQELWIWSTKTVSTRVNRNTIESKSSAPYNPNRRYNIEDYYYLYIIKKYKQLPLDDCIETLEKDYNLIFKRSSASYHLNKWGLTNKFKPKKDYKKFKDYDVWYLHIDITYGPKIDWKKMYIYVAIDRKTRLMYIELRDNKRAETANKFLKTAIEFFPFDIHTILTDNWKEFTLKNHKWKCDLIWLFDKICDEFGIKHKTTRPYTPKTNWMVEKCNDTIKRNTVGKTVYETKEEMNIDLISFMLFYNTKRRHWGIVKEIWKRTPMDALEYYYKLTPELFKESPLEFQNKLENIRIKYNIKLYDKRKM